MKKKIKLSLVHPPGEDRQVGEEWLLEGLYQAARGEKKTKAMLEITTAGAMAALGPEEGARQVQRAADLT